uniref:Uncharacterized protein n=1 Tax=viral metagenome TaxID=1070528 RepID=A0A6C0KWQ4_9ZZZZ
MNLYLIGFIAVAFMITVGGAYQLNSTGQTYGAVLFFIGSLILFIVYGMRWFGDSPLFTTTPGPWPPVINSCPDYLTYYKRTVGGIQKDTCIDTIGVSKDNSLLSTFPKDGSIPDNDSYYLDISGMSSDPATKNTQMCTAAINQKVTWEGVTNGESCVSPIAPGSSGSASGTGGASGAGGAGTGCPAPVAAH